MDKSFYNAMNEQAQKVAFEYIENVFNYGRDGSGPKRSCTALIEGYKNHGSKYIPNVFEAFVGTIKANPNTGNAMRFGFEIGIAAGVFVRDALSTEPGFLLRLSEELKLEKEKTS